MVSWRVLDLLSWLGLAVAILATAYLLTSLFWRPERNIHRSMLGHWFRSLIRLYESDSLVCVSHRGSGVRFTVLRRSGSGSRCWVVLSCPRSPWMAFPLDPVREAAAADSRVLVLPEPGAWEGGRVGGVPGKLFGTSVAVFLLSIPNRYLPILQQGEAVAGAAADDS